MESFHWKPLNAIRGNVISHLLKSDYICTIIKWFKRVKSDNNSSIIIIITLMLSNIFSKLKFIFELKLPFGFFAVINALDFQYPRKTRSSVTNFGMPQSKQQQQHQRGRQQQQHFKN